MRTAQVNGVDVLIIGSIAIPFSFVATVTLIVVLGYPTILCVGDMAWGWDGMGAIIFGWSMGIIVGIAALIGAGFGVRHMYRQFKKVNGGRL